jgi:hypothetical protein
MNVPYQLKPFIKRNGAGTKQFGEIIDGLCYPEADVKLVVDEAGAEVVSTTQLYVDGIAAIKVTDEIIFEGVTRPIQRINSFYRNGVADIKVVYL